jgi:hypothetical protein
MLGRHPNDCLYINLDVTGLAFSARIVKKLLNPDRKTGVYGKLDIRMVDT